jgi:fucose 4-O-acetylase-like acetyltransferase
MQGAGEALPQRRTRHEGKIGDAEVVMSRSSAALDNLRSFVILLVVGFHSVLAYLGSNPASRPPFDIPPYSWLGVPLIDDQRWFGFDLFCALQYVFLMPFMFFLSGLFVWPSLLRKGSWTFACDRAVRLGVPFVLGMFLLMPLAHYPVYRVTAGDPSWSAFWAHWMALPFWPSGPLWFLWQLLALNLGAAALYLLVPRAGEVLGRLSAGAAERPGRYFFLILIISCLAYLPLALKFRPWEWSAFGPFSFQPGRMLHYAVYFFAGVGVGAHGLDRGLLQPDGMLARRWSLWSGVAVAAFALWMLATALNLQGQGLPHGEIIAETAFALSSATACFAFAAVFLRLADTPWRAFSGILQNGYGIYLVHYAFVIWLQYLLLGTPLFAVAKGAIVFSGALTLSWASTAAACRMPFGARLIRAGRRSLVGARETA